PNTHIALSGRIERNDVTLPQGSFYTEVLTLRADYSFTPNISWANLAQYDNQSRIAGLQSRFRWILQLGNDLFLVLNRGWYRTRLNRHPSTTTLGHAERLQAAALRATARGTH